MIDKLKIYINIFNLLILVCLITYTILFFLKIKINFFSNFIILLSLSTLFIRLIFWYLIKKSSNLLKNISSNLLLARLGSSIFIYITPSFYIQQQPSLVMSNNVILITLIVISIIVFCGIFMEKYFFLYDTNQTFSNFNKSN